MYVCVCVRDIWRASTWRRLRWCLADDVDSLLRPSTNATLSHSRFVSTRLEWSGWLVSQRAGRRCTSMISLWMSIWLRLYRLTEMTTTQQQNSRRTPSWRAKESQWERAHKNVLFAVVVVGAFVNCNAGIIIRSLTQCCQNFLAKKS